MIRKKKTLKKVPLILKDYFDVAESMIDQSCLFQIFTSAKGDIILKSYVLNEDEGREYKKLTDDFFMAQVA